MELRAPRWSGREIDVHPVRFDAEGTGHLTTEAGKPFSHPAAGFAAVGTVNGRHVKCLSAEGHMVNHSESDYLPGHTDSTTCSC
jgi:lincosamide nucleotidyltransferase A/C/D/E